MCIRVFFIQNYEFVRSCVFKFMYIVCIHTCRHIDGCCFYYFIRNNAGALLEALSTRTYAIDCVNLYTHAHMCIGYVRSVDTNRRPQGSAWPTAGMCAQKQIYVQVM